MNSNFENVLIAKEVTEGVFETPTKAYSVISSNMNTKNETQRLSLIEGTIFSPNTVVPGKKMVSGSINSPASTDMLGVSLTGALGTPVTTGTGPVYEHDYDPNTYNLPTYTIETTKGSTINRSSGCKFSSVTLTNDNAAINVATEIVGLKAIDSERIIDVVGSDPYTVTFDNEVFFETSDLIDIYDSKGDILEGNVPVTVIDSSKSITIDPTSTTVTPGMIISLSKRVPSSKADNRPLRFLGDTTVKIEHGTPNEKEIGVTDLSLTISNNFKTDEGFRSGSYYSQVNEQGLRTITTSFTVYSDEILPFVTAQKGAEKLPIEVTLNGDSIDGTTNKSFKIKGIALVTDAPVDINSDTTYTANVSLEFHYQDIDTLKLTDGNSSY